QMREDDRVAVVIIPRRAWRRLQRHALGIRRHIALHELHAVDWLERGRKRSLQRAAERKAGGVTQEMIERDRASGIARALPRRDGHRLPPPSPAPPHPATRA